MAIDAEARKMEKWAASGDRTDPDDASLTPALVRANGWPATFSAQDGDVPRRRVLNQLFRELTGLGVDVIQNGILPHDNAVDYPEHAYVQESGVLYRALVANGPATSNVTTPGTDATVWATVTGETSNPEAPTAPSATTGNGELDFTWNCPLDGGSQITSFNFQWRRAGTTRWTTVVVTTPRYRLTGLTNGVSYEAHAQTVTAIGTSAYGAVGTAAPSAAAPSGGGQFGLRGDPGNGSVALSWQEPEDGGSTILDYTVQWRTAGQVFSTGRQATVTAREHTVSGLTNGTEYFFRVRARNSVNVGPWSSEDSATPVAPSGGDPELDSAANELLSDVSGQSLGAGYIAIMIRGNATDTVTLTVNGVQEFSGVGGYAGIFRNPVVSTSGISFASRENLLLYSVSPVTVS